MAGSTQILLIVTPLVLMLMPLVALCLGPRWSKQFCNAINALVGIQFGLSGLSLALYCWSGQSIERSLTSVISFIGVYLDGVSLMMLVLVSFVGWIICRFSSRYLDGEVGQNRYYGATALTIGAVSCMVMAGNLVQLWVAWVVTSFGLHLLLMHYSHRPAAQRAAWSKFTISRIGDVALIAAFVVVYREFETLNLSQLLGIAKTQSGPASIGVQAAGVLIAIGAITKSAQFPFHTWLPLTMETPTPVSALMHAGVVNAGGYLMIRVNPLISLSPLALWILVAIGAFTACYGAIVMMTQTSIKKKLAYSTIAQMGFMLMQCGLGAFSAAMLHILAHSLYKAHAFLSSGSVLNQRAAIAGASQTSKVPKWSTLLSFNLLAMSFVWSCFMVCGINLLQKPGGILLSLVLCSSIAYWAVRALTTLEGRAKWHVVPAAVGLMILYVASYAIVDRLVGPPSIVAVSHVATYILTCLIAIAFVGMLWLNIQLQKRVEFKWLNRMQIHASNGFYIENWLRRWFGSLLTS